MAEIIDFQQYKDKRRGELNLESLFQRCGKKFDRAIRIRDFPDEVLLNLAEGGVEGNALLDNLVMAVWDMNPVDIRDLPPPIRMRLLDISLLLIDQLRFECMARLGWIDPLPIRDIPLVELIHSEDEARRRLRKTPQLKAGHAQFHCFQRMMDIERETFIRRQIPAALEQFRLRLRRR
jgi:hypothetical protein